MCIAKNKFLIAAGLAIGIATIASAYAAASVVLRAGTYHFTASSKANCKPPDLDLDGVNTFIYGGPGKPGSAISSAYSRSFSFYFGEYSFNTANDVTTLDLPDAPASGVADWSGAYSGSTYSQSSSNARTSTSIMHRSGQFALELTALSPTTFHGILKLTPKSGVSCTTEIYGVP